MTGSGETSDTSKYDDGNNPTPDKGEAGKEMNTGNIRGKHTHKRKELVQLHAAHIYFKSNTPKLGAVLGLMSKKLDIGTAFEKFIEKLKGYVERKF